MFGAKPYLVHYHRWGQYASQSQERMGTLKERKKLSVLLGI